MKPVDGMRQFRQACMIWGSVLLVSVGSHYTESAWGLGVCYAGVALLSFAAWRAYRQTRGMLNEPAPEPPKRRTTCVRCAHPNLDAANFCAACGHMLKTHQEVDRWMFRQREMLQQRKWLGDEAKEAARR